MKARVEAMGPVNMMALEEFQECEQRENFLRRERDDLVQSIQNTQLTINELDEVSRQKFEEAFQFINASFAIAFQSLFGGGHGEMRLSEPDSSGEAGIDIVAQPPGKRLQNILLFSGGEKALTALALLIAVFRYRPSPFCILDEVDAPLDEANVGRFNQHARRNVRPDAVHRRHPQPQDDGNGLGPLRRHHAGARRVEARLREMGRRRRGIRAHSRSRKQRRLRSSVAQASSATAPLPVISSPSYRNFKSIIAFLSVDNVSPCARIAASQN